MIKCFIKDFVIRTKKKKSKEKKEILFFYLKTKQTNNFQCFLFFSPCPPLYSYLDDPMLNGINL